MKPRSATVFEVYRSFDPVLWEHNDRAAMAEYAVERDVSTLTIPEGAQPILFRCRSLTRDQRARVDEASTMNGRNVMAFRLGVLAISNIDRPDGGYFAPVMIERGSEKDPITPAVLDSLEELGFGEADFRDVGAAIMARSFLARGVPQRCVLPDSSLHACGLLYSLRAERQTVSATPMAEPSSSAPSSAAADPDATPQG